MSITVNRGELKPMTGRLTTEEREYAEKLAADILRKAKGPEKRCRHKWADTNCHDTYHWMKGEKLQWCNKCGKEKWVPYSHPETK
jgi:hypothetical protein